MKKNEVELKECSARELQEINGGLLGGAIAGAILGAATGCIVAGVATIADGNYSTERLYKTIVTFTFAGAAIGTATPV